MSADPSETITIPKDHEVIQAWESHRRPAVLHRKGNSWYVSWKERDESQQTQTFDNEHEAWGRFTHLKTLA